jgi:uncharacterized protein
MSAIDQQNSIVVQIGEIEEILRNIPHHKGTDHYIGKMRARLAHLRDKQIESEIKSKGGGGGGGYAVRKTGDASVVLIGPPSCGKSTLINMLTNAQSKVAEYSFTTLSVIPGMLLYRDAYIQIFDVPGIIEGAGAGKGRGKEVLSVARNCDLLVIMSDVKRRSAYSSILSELHKVGIRINDTKPNVLVEKKTEGGLSLKTNLHQSLDKETIKDIILEMGVKNAEITLKENITIDRLIDSLSSSRVYVPAIFVLNKIDEDRNYLSHLNDLNHLSGSLIPISADKDIGLTELKSEIWKALQLVKLYLVEDGFKPDFSQPMIAYIGSTLADVALSIGSNFAQSKKLANIWGPGSHFPGQEVPLTTKVQEGMQIRFVAKS